MSSADFFNPACSALRVKDNETKLIMILDASTDSDESSSFRQTKNSAIRVLHVHAAVFFFPFYSIVHVTLHAPSKCLADDILKSLLFIFIIFFSGTINLYIFTSCESSAVFHCDVSQNIYL